MSTHSPKTESKSDKTSSKGFRKPMLTPEEVDFLNAYIKYYENEIIEASKMEDASGESPFIKLRRAKPDRPLKEYEYSVPGPPKRVQIFNHHSVEFIVTYEDNKPIIRAIAIGGKDKEDVLGEGSFGKVKVAEIINLDNPREAGELIARKRIVIPSEASEDFVKQVIRNFLEEAEFQGDVLAYIARTMRSKIMQDDSITGKTIKLCLYIPKESGYNLFDYYYGNSKKGIAPHALTYSEKYNICIEIVEDLIKRFHSKGIIHRDLYMQNIIVDPVTKKPKIIDVGYAVNLNKEKKKIHESKQLESIFIPSVDASQIPIKLEFKPEIQNNQKSMTLFRIKDEILQEDEDPNEALFYSPLNGEAVGYIKMPEVEYIPEDDSQLTPMYSFRSDLGNLGEFFRSQLKLTDRKGLSDLGEFISPFIISETNILLDKMTTENPSLRVTAKEALKHFYAIKRVKEYEQNKEPLTPIPSKFESAVEKLVMELFNKKIKYELALGKDEFRVREDIPEKYRDQMKSHDQHQLQTYEEVKDRIEHSKEDAKHILESKSGSGDSLSSYHSYSVRNPLSTQSKKPQPKDHSSKP